MFAISLSAHRDLVVVATHSLLHHRDTPLKLLLIFMCLPQLYLPYLSVNSFAGICAVGNLLVQDAVDNIAKCLPGGDKSLQNPAPCVS